MPECRTVECSFARLEKIRRLCKELRAAAPYLLAVHSYRIFGSAVQDTNRLWGTHCYFFKSVPQLGSAFAYDIFFNGIHEDGGHVDAGLLVNFLKTGGAGDVDFGDVAADDV